MLAYNQQLFLAGLLLAFQSQDGCLSNLLTVIATILEINKHLYAHFQERDP